LLSLDDIFFHTFKKKLPLYEVCNTMISSSPEPESHPLSSMQARLLPNILITGTPGTGKTTMSELVCLATNLNHINVGDLVKAKQLHDGWDDKFQCYIVNEDKVCDELEEIMNQGGNVIDFHTVDFFPERWFDLVVVLRASNDVLHPRLVSRYALLWCINIPFFCIWRLPYLLSGDSICLLFPIKHFRNYSELKISENITAEIMQVILEEAHENYREEIVIELSSNNIEEMEQNVEQVCDWAKQWVEARKCL
jgi:adenylate kinase